MQQLQIAMAAQPEVDPDYRRAVVDMLNPPDPEVVQAQQEHQLDELRQRGIIRRVPAQRASEEAS